MCVCRGNCVQKKILILVFCLLFLICFGSDKINTGVNRKFAVLSTSTRKARLDLNEIDISQTKERTIFLLRREKLPIFY